MDTNTTAAAANDAALKKFERLLRNNLVELRNGLAFEIASVEGKERLAQFATQATRCGLSIAHQRAGGSAVKRLGNVRDDITPARLVRIGDRTFRYVLTLGSGPKAQVVAGAAVGGVKPPGRRPEEPERYMTREEIKQRRDAIAEWEKNHDDFRLLTLWTARFSLVPLNGPMPKEGTDCACDVLCVHLKKDGELIPELAELPAGAQELVEALTVDFVGGCIERLEEVDARQRQEAKAAHVAAKRAEQRARMEAVEAEAERQAHERRRGR